MPQCPECGHSGSASQAWFASVDSSDYDEDVHYTRSLVVCPSCDIVLGGADTYSTPGMCYY